MNKFKKYQRLISVIIMVIIVLVVSGYAVITKLDVQLYELIYMISSFPSELLNLTIHTFLSEGPFYIRLPLFALILLVIIWNMIYKKPKESLVNYHKSVEDFFLKYKR